MSDAYLLGSDGTVPELPPAFRSGQKLKMKWIDYLGNEWDFSNPASGVFLVREGVEGLGYPEIRNFVTSSAVVNGVQWDGYIIPGRKVFWALMIYHDGSSMDWVELNRSFFRTLHPGRTGRWVVTTPDGVEMALTLRLADGADSVTAYDADPIKRGWQMYGIEMFPEQPLWEGAVIQRSWDEGEDESFFGPTGFGPDFFIGTGSRASLATVTNRGDAETYVRWTVEGPASPPLEVGIDGLKTPIPFPIPEGSTLLIDTHPTRLIAELDGVDVMHLIPEFDPSPLEPGISVELSLRLTGGGAIKAEFPELYFRRI